jgi:hypothetical protein
MNDAPLTRRYSGTACVIGTGPSLTLGQIESARSKGFTLFGCNNVYQTVPDLAVLFATNAPWWFHYLETDEKLRDGAFEKWTNNEESAEKYARYGLRYIKSRDAPGLSQNPKRLHHGHSSGFCLLNLAYLMGAERIVLLGFDMKYAPDYDGRERTAGSTPRHYFGEYPSLMRHWPKVSITNGVLHGLIDVYRRVAEQNLVEIINCTPDSALDCFPRMNIDDVALGTSRSVA